LKPEVLFQPLGGEKALAATYDCIAQRVRKVLLRRPLYVHYVVSH